MNDKAIISCSLEPLSPLNFIIMSEYHNTTETTVSLTWEQPQLPAGVTDNYTIYFLAPTFYEPNIYLGVIPPWNVTVAHNTQYSVNVTATNCAGESQPSNIILNYGETIIAS